MMTHHTEFSNNSIFHEKYVFLTFAVRSFDQSWINWSLFHRVFKWSTVFSVLCLVLVSCVNCAVLCRVQVVSSVSCVVSCWFLSVCQFCVYCGQHVFCALHRFLQFLSSGWGDCEDLPALVDESGSPVVESEGEEGVRQWQRPFLLGVDVRTPPRLVDYSNSEGESEGEEEEEEEESQVGAGDGNRDGVPLPIEEYYELSQAFNVYIRKFKLHGKAYHVQLRNIDQMVDLEAVMVDLIRTALRDVFEAGDPTDLIGVTFKHPGLRRGQYHIPFQPRDTLTPARIFQILEALIGYDEVNVDANFEIVFTRVTQTRGGRGQEKTWNRAQFMKKHTQTFIDIFNPNDDLCLPRALVTAKARLELAPKIAANDRQAIRQWDTIRKGDRSRCTRQKRLAQELARDAGLEDHVGPYGEREIQKLQEVLEPEYQIKIFSSRCANCIVFEGKIPPENPENVLHIYHLVEDGESVGHFLVLAKPHVLFTKQHWCDTCNKGYDDKTKHRCISKCNCCFKLKKCPLEGWKHCSECNRNFRSEQCFQNHITVAQGNRRGMEKDGENSEKKRRTNLSICDKFKTCTSCGVLINYVSAKKKFMDGKLVALHKCGWIYCRNCETDHPEGEHCCFMQPIREKKKKGGSENLVDSGYGVVVDSPKDPKEKEKEISSSVLDEAEVTEKEREEEKGRSANVEDLLGLLGDNDPDEEELESDSWGTKIFFDFESSQTRIIGENNLGPILEHIPNYCHARKVCTLCQTDAEKGKFGGCVNCKEGEWVFKGEACQEDFCKWLFDEPNRGVTVIAHNSKGYDSQFLVQYLIRECRIPKVITKGTEFMKVECQGIRVIDSLNFFPMGLAELPKAFNIKELKKGFFPHKFNTPENQNYIGEIPDAWFYDPGNMKEKKREQFHEWHTIQRNSGLVFDFAKELAEYCRSDVDILMRSCLKFERECVELVDIRPFDVAITIASFCMYLFRKKFLKVDSIGLIPHSGYRGRENQSLIGLRWLKWMSEQEDIYIQHAGNGYEKKIGKYKVDGFHAETNTVYEFNGCVWHGHTCRQDRKKKVPNSRKTEEDVYQEWVSRKQFLESQGYRVVVKWECELRKELRDDPQMKEFFDTVEIRDPLDVTQALRGGRTNAVRLHYKCKPGERMDYVDVVSLYPWGVKWTKFPKGHPQVITENFKEITPGRNPYFGIIKCEILPPRRLFHGVLPYKSGGKLMFPLCRSCAGEQRQDFCDHSDTERAFTGEFVSTELDKALEKGYRILKVHEVWHYPETEQHDGKNENTGLFTGYINFFLKLKIEASGWPEWVKTEEDRAEFLAECERREGIKLDPSKIEKNPGKRQVAKLCLNSFWGKFGQRSNMSKDEFIIDPKKFQDVMFNQTNVVENVRVINEEILLVSYRKEEEFTDLMPYMNKVIAAFTTANCRLRLYEELEKLGERVCYFDTDSIIYITRPGDTYHPRMGSFLGDMTDELEEFGPGAKIQEFVSGGPKNYGFKVLKADGTTETKVKIRGFTLNFHAANKLNFNTLKKKVFAFVGGEVEKSKTTIVQPMIARTNDRRVVTKDVAKNYSVVYDKRWVKPDLSTLPYGTCVKVEEDMEF